MDPFTEEYQQFERENQVQYMHFSNCTGIYHIEYNLHRHIIIPRVCTRGKAISLSVCVCVFVSTKITRSGDLGVIAKCKYHYSVGKVGKLTFFSLLDA